MYLSTPSSSSTPNSVPASSEKRGRPGARGKRRRQVPREVAPLHYSILLLVTSSPLGVLFSGVLQALAGDSGARGTTGSNTQPHRLGRVYHFRSTGTNPPPAARRTRLASQAVDAWYNALDWKLIRSTRARESRRASHSVRKRARRIAKRRQSSAPRRGRQDDKVISCRSEALWSSSSPSHTHSCTGRTYPLWPPP